MQEGNFKNTIVLKDVKSNLIEEAIIVLKENKEARSLNKIENRNKGGKKDLKPIKKDYIEKDIENRNLKYKRLKKYAYFTTFFMLMQIIIIFCT